MVDLLRKFNLPSNTATFVCNAVFEGAPILHVVHDSKGEWEFLCGADHSDGKRCPPKVVCLAEVLKMDETVAEVGDLCINWSATRKSVPGEWLRQDGLEETIRENIREYGWHVSIIAPDENPGFAYSIGLFQSFRQPEVIVFGIPANVMHGIIDECGDRFKSGQSISTDVPMDGFIRSFPVVFKPVSKGQYREYFGYGLWYYGGLNFPALQCVWPDKSGKFPWDAGVSAKAKRLQPLLQ